MRIHAVIMAVWLGCMAAQAAGAADSPPTLELRSCETPPVVDGALDDACWQTAAVMTDFKVFLKNTPALYPTLVKATHDRNWLYLAFTCEHPRPDLIVASALDHDGPVGGDESIEVFLDPGSEGEFYYQFGFNTANVKMEQRLVRGERDRAWEIPWRTATRIGKKEWTAEAAIPLSILPGHGDVERLRLNVARNAVIPVIDPQAVVVGQSKENSLWSPVEHSFHEPNHFGYVRGIDWASVEVPFMASLVKTEVGKYYLKGGLYYYDVACEVRGIRGKSGNVTVTLREETGPNSAREFTSAQVALAGDNKVVPVTVSVPVSSLTDRKVWVVLKDAATQGELVKTLALETSLLDLVECYADRSYYTTETQAFVVFAAGLPEEALTGLMLSARDAGGKEVAHADKLTGTAKIAIPLKDAPAGSHPYSITVSQKEGQPLYKKEITLTKREPKPGCEWKIDRINKVLLRENKPFFPFGWIMAGVGPQDEAAFRDAAEAGMNTVLQWGIGEKPEEARKYSDAAAKYGLMAVGWLDGAYARQSRFETGLEKILDEKLSEDERNMVFGENYRMVRDDLLNAARRMKECPNLLTYTYFEETMPGFRQYEFGRDLYRAINETDGYRPCFVLYSSTIPAGPEWTDWMDILGTDPYWIPAGPGFGFRGDINFVSKVTLLTRKRAEARQQVTWIVPVAEIWSALHARAILPDEQICQTYLALIHGAKGLFYFCYPFAHRETYETFVKIGKQLQTLGPLAVMPEVPQVMQYRPRMLKLTDRSIYDPDEFPDVQARLMQSPDGEYLLLAANSRWYPAETVFELSCLDDAGTVKQLFTDKSHAVKDKTFSDMLEPYGTRAYALGKTGKEERPVEITVTVKAPPDIPPARGHDALTPKGRLGRKNAVPNPGFEQATLPGWPDYFKITTCAGILPDERIGASHAIWGQDEDNPYEGKRSLRIFSKRSNATGFYLYFAPDNPKAMQYVYSLFMRADKDGTPVKLIVPGKAWNEMKTVEVSREWQRHQVAFEMPAKAEYHTSFGVRILNKVPDVTVWIDAVQIEPGGQATEFEP